MHLFQHLNIFNNYINIWSHKPYKFKTKIRLNKRAQVQKKGFPMIFSSSSDCKKLRSDTCSFFEAVFESVGSRGTRVLECSAELYTGFTV